MERGKRKRKGHNKKKKERQNAEAPHSKKPRNQPAGSSVVAAGAGEHFYGIPDELILFILSKLEIYELCRCSLVCSSWRRYSQADNLWQSWYGVHTGIYASSWRQLFSIKYLEINGLDALKAQLGATKRSHRRGLLFMYPLDKKYSAPGLRYGTLYESAFKLSSADFHAIVKNEVTFLLKDPSALEELRPSATEWLSSAVCEYPSWSDQLCEMNYGVARAYLMDMLLYEGDYNMSGQVVASPGVDGGAGEGEVKEVEGEERQLTDMKKGILKLLQQVNASESEEEEEEEGEGEEGESKRKGKEKEKKEVYLTNSGRILRLPDKRRPWFSESEAKALCVRLLQRFPPNKARFCRIGPLRPLYKFYVTGLICLSSSFFALYWIEANPDYPIDV